MSPTPPRRRTRATGFSPGGPRELTDAPRRQNRGGRRTTAAGKAAPTTSTRTADTMDLDKVDSKSGADEPVSLRRGRGQTRSLRARTRSSSPLEETGLPDNRRTSPPPRVADVARSPRRGHAGLGKGRGKHARDEDTLVEVEGPAEEAGGESTRSSVIRPAKRLRAGDRGGEAIRRQMEREKRSQSPPTAPAVTTPSGVRASVLRVGASALKYLGFRTESPRPVAEGDGASSPSPEVSSREALLSTAESSSGQEAVKSTGGPSSPDSGALAPAVLHERAGEELMREHRREAELRKLLKLGRRNVVPLKAPSECGSDDEEAAKAAYRFTEELRPVSLPSYDASARYVGWKEGSRGMLVAEEESTDSKEDNKRTEISLSPTPVSSFVSSLAAPVATRPVVERGRTLVRIPITNADILTAVKTALGWFNKNPDTVPGPEEMVSVLDKYRSDQLASTTGRTYRAPSPSDPWSDNEFESDTGEAMDRYDGYPIPPARNPRRRKITARSVPDFDGPADGHLPVSLQGLPFNLLPREWQNHKKSWKIKQRDEIAAAQLADRRDRGIDEDDYQMGLRSLALQENQKRLRESRLVAAGKAVNDRIRLGHLQREKHALRALAEERRAKAAKTAGEPTWPSKHERAGRSPVAQSPGPRAPRCASLPRYPTISEEADEGAFTIPAAPAPKIVTTEAETPSPAAPLTAPKTAATLPPVPRRGGKKPRVYPAEWAGLPINPRTHLPEGMVGLFSGINYFSDSDDYSSDEESTTATLPTTITPAANVAVSGANVDVGAIVDSIPSHEFQALFASHDVGATDVDIASIVDSISRDDLEALIGIPLPSASNSRDNDTAANFAISDDVMAMVEAIPDRDFDEMMGGILA